MFLCVRLFILETINSSSSSPFPATFLEFAIFSEILAYLVGVLLLLLFFIQPYRESYLVFMDGACWVLFFFFFFFFAIQPSET